jgi:hypothetical protein
MLPHRPSHVRPFAPGAHPPRWERGAPADRDWYPWEAQHAWAPGAVFFAGVDDLDLLAQAVPRDNNGGCPVLAAVELPADPLGQGFGGTIQHVHVDRAGGVRTAMVFADTEPRRPAGTSGRGPLIATVEAALYGVSADRTALLLAPAASHDPFPVPMNYLVSITHADSR